MVDDDDDSDYGSGGLSLTPGDFSQLSACYGAILTPSTADLYFAVALMCLFQIVYQFHLYP